MIDLEPYLDKESAILWLSRHLEKASVDVKCMYHLNIINALIQNGKEIFGRIPQEVFSGLPEGGRRNVQASVIARAVSGSDRGEPQEVGPSGYTRTQEAIGAWAERDGCWHDYADSYLREKGMQLATSGSEANVYAKGIYVYKVNDITHYETIDRLLDRITIHNTVFPETRLEVVGFGMKDEAEDNLGFSVILRQPLVQGTNEAHPQQVFDSMIRRDLSPINATSWVFTSQTRNIVLHDIHDQNLIVTKGGRVVFFDCDASLNTDPKMNGKYRIPPVEGSERSVRKIDEILEEICPKEIPLSSLRDKNPFAYLNLSGKQFPIARIKLDSSDESSVRLVCPHPDKPGWLLAIAPSKAKIMMNYSLPQGQRDKLLAGETVSKNGRTVFFNIAKGRLDTYTGRTLNKKVTI